MKHKSSTVFLDFDVPLAAAQMDDSSYSISIDIDISKDKAILAVLDFKSYQKWNSVLKMESNDELIIGKNFQVTILKGKKPERFQAMLLHKDESSFSARQIIFRQWLFAATHFFIIEETGPNSSRLVQRWKLSGLLYRIFKSKILKTLAFFKTMNIEFKNYVENE